MTSALVILSGGLDSTTLLYDIVKSNLHDSVYAISFNYGQRHSRELRCASVTTQRLDINHTIVDMHSTGSLLSSALTSSDIDVPHEAYDDDSQRLTVVPNRNMIMISIAAGVAISKGASFLYYGAHSNDAAIYPDCRPQFVDAMQQALEYCHYDPIYLSAPYLLMTKGDIVKRGLDLGVHYEDTWTCYEGGSIACGKCGSCDERLKAFAEAGSIDPIPYNVLEF